MDARDCGSCRSISLCSAVFLFTVGGAVGFSALPPEWREPLARGLLGVTAAGSALFLGVLLLMLIESVWARYVANPLRHGNGVCCYEGEVVYGWQRAGRNLRLITRRRQVGMQARLIAPRMFARSRAVAALEQNHVPEVSVDTDAIGRGILRWGEQPRLLPLLDEAGLLAPHRTVFGREELPEPSNAVAWRELCNALWKQPHERPLALMLATRCADAGTPPRV
jgi:hypothetical protein